MALLPCLPQGPERVPRFERLPRGSRGGQAATPGRRQSDLEKGSSVYMRPRRVVSRIRIANKRRQGRDPPSGPPRRRGSMRRVVAHDGPQVLGRAAPRKGEAACPGRSSSASRHPEHKRATCLSVRPLTRGLRPARGPRPVGSPASPRMSQMVVLVFGIGLQQRGRLSAPPPAMPQGQGYRRGACGPGPCGAVRRSSSRRDPLPVRTAPPAVGSTLSSETTAHRPRRSARQGHASRDRDARASTRAPAAGGTRGERAYAVDIGQSANRPGWPRQRGARLPMLMAVTIWGKAPGGICRTAASVSRIPSVGRASSARSYREGIVMLGASGHEKDGFPTGCRRSGRTSGGRRCSAGRRVQEPRNRDD